MCLCFKNCCWFLHSTHNAKTDGQDDYHDEKDYSNHSSYNPRDQSIFGHLLQAICGGNFRKVARSC